MLRIQDRLYGSIELPDLAWELIESCPLVMRLREVRMANLPFLTHPSFANVDRFEHSVGVAHLAWRWARMNQLPEDLAKALTIAALYHDGATPAFGHLFEEFLSRFGFDHESELVSILQGTPTGIPGREHAQLFLGRSCKLRDILPSPSSASSPLTPLGISELAAGRGPLGKLIKGDIDLDNIDNVIRSSTAMGLADQRQMIHPYNVCDAIRLEDGELRLARRDAFAIGAWKAMRGRLYESILTNALEFRAQTAIKWAIEEHAKIDGALATPGAWVLTDPMLVFEHLRNSKFSRMLIDSVRAGRPPMLMFSAWIDDLSPILGEGSERVIATLCEELGDVFKMKVYVNYYLDKRHRSVGIVTSRQASLFDEVYKSERTFPEAVDVGTKGGIIGAIAVTEAAHPHPEVQQISAARPIVPEGKLEDIVQRSFRSKPIAISRRWLGTRRARSPRRAPALGFEGSS